MFAGLEGEDSLSNSNSKSNSGSFTPNATTVTHFTLAIGRLKFRGCHTTDGAEHYVDVGKDAFDSNPNMACVRVAYYADESPDKLDLNWVGWRASCSTPRDGTLTKMLSGTLKYALGAFEHCDRINLMDTSKVEFELPGARPLARRMGRAEQQSTKASLGDLYSVTRWADNGGRCLTWYMAALGAEPAERETADVLDINAIALRRRVLLSGDAFCESCFPPSGDAPRLLGGAEAVAAIRAVVDDAMAAGASWGDLLARIGGMSNGTSNGKSNGKSAAIAYVLPRLPDILPGWRSVSGRAFVIHDARRKILGGGDDDDGDGARISVELVPSRGQP